jgi:hypothetical protein
MADVVRSVDYYYTMVPDEPGAGLRALAQLKDAGVDLSAYLGSPLGEGSRRSTWCRKMPVR